MTIKSKRTNSAVGLRDKSLIIVLIISLLGGAYAIKRYKDHLDKKVVLLPQQQQIEGYVHRKVIIKDKAFNVYHPASYVVEPVNLKIAQPRMISFHGDVLFIGSSKGSVYRLFPPYNRATQIAQMRYYPHSILVRDNEIFIARTIGVIKAPYSEDEDFWLKDEDMEEVVSMVYTNSHSSRSLKVGPDNKLYLSAGWPGNCNNFYVHESYPQEKRLGGIFSIDESKQPAALVPFAAGLRNPVGFDWHPDTGVMYASNNGPDHLGYDQPLEYFAKVTLGSFHGMPWYQYNGKQLVVDKCAKTAPPKPIEEVSIPVATFPGHNAPLDVLFVDEKANASEYYGDAIVALHGSWATSDGSARGDPASKRHPKLVRVKFDKNGEAGEVIDLVSGFQDKKGDRWARPAGLAIGPDGDIYFTSDKEIQGLFRLRKIE
jgi:glucose/arabinose dehydrogenase